MIFFSRHNSVRCITPDGRPIVRKHYADLPDWRAELDALRLLSGRAAVPGILSVLPGFLLMEYLPFPTLLDELERQESSAFHPAPWQALCHWLEDVHAASGLVPTDGNLRNFLWDHSGSALFGVDFEHYRPGLLTDAACRIAAYILEYTPTGTPVKHRAARILSEHFRLSCGQLERSRALLRHTRASMRRSSLGSDFSFIILAGGQSRRMGRDKASLDLLGVSFLESQLETARMLGVDDVLISCPHDIDERCIPDELPDRGPLGGLHACMKRARHDRCIVLSVDVPLLPASLLRELAEAHLRSGSPITLAVHEGRFEPLVGIYNSCLADAIEPLIRGGGAPMRALLRDTPWQPFHSALPESLWNNCNTPEEYQTLIQTNTERI